MLNNKGQSLVLFVVVLPILLLILVMIIDIGRAITMKQELDNVNKIVLDYGLDNLDKDNIEDELINLIKLNNSEIEEINVKLEDNKLYIKLNSDFNEILLGIANIKVFDIKSYYVGYIENDEKRIEKVSG